MRNLNPSSLDVDTEYSQRISDIPDLDQEAPVRFKHFWDLVDERRHEVEGERHDTEGNCTRDCRTVYISLNISLNPDAE